MNSDWLPPNAARPPSPMSLPPFLELLSGRLQSAAVDLRAQHVAEVGFRLQPALEAVDELAALDWAVLGGDVWQTGGSVPKPTYDNWHADRGPKEDWGAYVRRSADYSRNRITLFDTAQPSGTALFALVPSSEPGYNALMRDRGDG
jgi:hypothetical protein